jgi:NADPH:quinone reductase-like Zn-dependent oxidoreductase
VPIGHAHYNAARNPIAGDMPYFMLLLLRGLLDRKKREAFSMIKKPEAMAVFGGMLASGKLTSLIAKTFPLEDVPAAMKWMMESETPGRVVITP